MKAVQFARTGAPDVLQVQEAPDPVPGSNDVLIDVKATTVNRLDLFQRDGSRPVNALPFTPGLEAAGVVVQDAHGFRAGEHVLTSKALAAKGGGGYASRIAAPASHLVRIPDGVSFEEAAAAGLAASTAWGSLFDLGRLKAGERVLIWAGSSGVGSMAIQLAKHTGAWVATTASSEERAEFLRKLGADLVINHRQQNIAKTLQDAGGANLVIELVSSTLQTSLEACAPDARIILIGNLGGQQATVDTQAWRLKRVVVIGGGQLTTSTENEHQILQLIAQKAITPLIAQTLPVAKAAEAHRLLAAGKPQGKIVLTHQA
ncbi:MAG TPA: zinc-binding dehydrogenase [Ktedonosporobacter sp.]|jgi:NADPH:quinone reductase-like Zn-dependent oxidoreductase|nr:zinc-binding dehydrogenase [Ktedonosporobacter sp.]